MTRNVRTDKVVDMGTNYYWIETKTPSCQHCGRPAEEEKLHIGKSSAGWCFSLHVDDDIKSLHDWELKWTGNGRIENEYGESLTPAEMLLVITARSRPDPCDWSRHDYGRNYGEPGPNNLVRHSIGPYCVGHGEGTWDLIPGYFS